MLKSFLDERNKSGEDCKDDLHNAARAPKPLTRSVDEERIPQWDAMDETNYSACKAGDVASNLGKGNGQ